MKTVQITKESYPTLDDYKSIKSYEDACIALGEPVHEHSGLKKVETAYLKLKTISRALWGRNSKPVPDAIGDKIYYYPWFALYTKSEVDKMDDEERGALFARAAGHSANEGFGILYVALRSSDSYSYAGTGFRLYQETEEKAIYFGKQFLELWADYFLF